MIKVIKRELSAASEKIIYALSSVIFRKHRFISCSTAAKLPSRRCPRTVVNARYFICPSTKVGEWLSCRVRQQLGLDIPQFLKDSKQVQIDRINEDIEGGRVE